MLPIHIRPYHLTGNKHHNHRRIFQYSKHQVSRIVAPNLGKHVLRHIIVPSSNWHNIVVEVEVRCLDCTHLILMMHSSCHNHNQNVPCSSPEVLQIVVPNLRKYLKAWHRTVVLRSMLDNT